LNNDPRARKLKFSHTLVYKAFKLYLDRNIIKIKERIYSENKTLKASVWN